MTFCNLGATPMRVDRSIRRLLAVGGFGVALTVGACADTPPPATPLIGSSNELDSKLSNPLVAGVAKRSSGDSMSAEGRKRLAFFFSLGPWVSTQSDQIAQGLGGSTTVGAEAALGYRYAVSSVDLALSFRGQAFSFNQGGNSASIVNSVVEFDVLFRIGRFYIGPGIGAATSTGSTSNITLTTGSQAIGTAVLGYDLTDRFFIESRYQGSSVPAQTGSSLVFGIRF